MKKYCSCCKKKFGIKNNFCPICGEELQIIDEIDLKKTFEPYLKGTGFTIVENINGSTYPFRFGEYNGSDKVKDTKKIIKSFLKSKPDFLVPMVNVYNNFGKLRFEIDLIFKEASICSHLFLPVNKSNTNLILRLVGKESAFKLADECQSELDRREYLLKEYIDVIKQYKDLKKQLPLKEVKTDE